MYIFLHMYICHIRKCKAFHSIRLNETLLNLFRKQQHIVFVEFTLYFSSTFVLLYYFSKYGLFYVCCGRHGWVIIDQPLRHESSRQDFLFTFLSHFSQWATRLIPVIVFLVHVSIFFAYLIVELILVLEA